MCSRKRPAKIMGPMLLLAWSKSRFWESLNVLLNLVGGFPKSGEIKFHWKWWMKRLSEVNNWAERQSCVKGKTQSVQQMKQKPFEEEGTNKQIGRAAGRIEANKMEISPARPVAAKRVVKCFQIQVQIHRCRYGLKFKVHQLNPECFLKKLFTTVWDSCQYGVRVIFN